MSTHEVTPTPNGKPLDMPKPPKTVDEYLRYDFTEDELKEKSKELARALQMKERAESEQKAAQAQFKDRVESQQNVISRVGREIYSGWEMRNIQCRVDFHTPTTATKRITRIDTGEIVREAAMNYSELQENLFGDELEEQIETAGL